MQSLFTTISSDYFIPLSVDTNIVYTIDEGRFPGLNDRQHHTEPALMTVPGFQLTALDVTDPNVTGSENPLVTFDHENLFDLIDSWDDFDVECPSENVFDVLPELTMSESEMDLHATGPDIPDHFVSQVNFTDVKSRNNEDDLDRIIFTTLQFDSAQKCQSISNHQPESVKGNVNRKRTFSEIDEVDEDIRCSKRGKFFIDSDYCEWPLWIGARTKFSKHLSKASSGLISMLNSSISTSSHCAMFFTDINLSPSGPAYVREW